MTATQQSAHTKPMEAVLKSRPLRVCIATRFTKYGGGALQALSLARSLARLGAEVTVLAARLPGAPALESQGDIKILRLTSLGVGRVGRVREGLVFGAHFWRANYDVIYVVGDGHLPYAAIVVGKLTGKRVAVKMTLLDADDPVTIRAQHLGRLKLAVLARADGIVSISSALAERYLVAGMPHLKLWHISNGVDTDRFRPADRDERRALRARLALPPDAPIVVYVGAIIPRKGVADLVEAWRRIAKRYPSALLLLMGPESGSGEDDRAYVDAIRQSVSDLIEAGRIVFAGQRDDVEDYLRAADIFVLPSYREGMPNALLEAMASGLACVASDIPGVADIAKRGEVLTFVPGDVGELVERLESALRDPEELKRLGRERVVEGFSMHTIARRYVSKFLAATESG